LNCGNGCSRIGTIGVAVRLLGEQRMGRGDEARRAEATLQGVVLAEGLLQRRQIVIVGQAFDRDDLRTFRLHGEDQAGAHRGTIHQHGAGAANAMLAADVGAGQPQLVAQAIDQRHARLDLDADLLAVDLEFRHAWSQFLPLHLAAAALSARSVIVPVSDAR
jgi:hypothetical protein